MTDHDAELDAMAAEMEAAGLITISTGPDGSIAYQLTPVGERMAQQVALSGDDSGPGEAARARVDAGSRGGAMPRGSAVMISAWQRPGRTFAKVDWRTAGLYYGLAGDTGVGPLPDRRNTAEAKR